MRAPGLILLAAGGSTRMGTPKQLLPWSGQTLLRRAGETALQTSCRPVVVVLGCEAQACRAQCAGLSVITVVNENWPQGLGSSIAVGLAALETEAPDIPGVVFLLVDQPGVTPEWLEQLVKPGADPAWPIVATAYEDKAGVPALFARQFFDDLRRLPPNEGARSLLEREREHVRLLDPGPELYDLDTPEDYRLRAQELNRRPGETLDFAR